MTYSAPGSHDWQVKTAGGVVLQNVDSLRHRLRGGHEAQRDIKAGLEQIRGQLMVLKIFHGGGMVQEMAIKLGFDFLELQTRVHHYKARR